ncbi:hypothetical protein [Sorangium sp. So ce1024]|uniref:hypothetical protein n=1 Tax=unclassified Sorangium TaxID=2621164 RepID=UPI003F114231
MTTSTEALSQVWSSYVEGINDGGERVIDPAAVERELRAALLHEALGDLGPGSRAALVAAGAWTPATGEAVSRLLGDGAATEPAQPVDAATAAALLRRGLDRVAWDAALFAVQSLIVLLPADRREEAFRTLVVASASLPSAYMNPEAHGYTPGRAEAERRRRALLREPSEPSIHAFLAAVRDLEESARWPLLLDAAPLLPEQYRAEALGEALSSAFAVADELHAGQAVAAVVLRAPGFLIEPALSRASEAWAGLDSRTSLLRALAESLPVEYLGPVLDELGTIADEWTRADVLAGVRTRLPQELRGRWDELAAAIEDESARGMLEPLETSQEPPPPGARSLVDVVNGWGSVARALGGDPRAAAIAEAAVRFIARTTQLYDQTARQREST